MSIVAATAIGAGLSFIGGLAANAINKQTANENLAYQKQANAQNIAFTKEMNAQNIAFQKEENTITRSREDNAVQRAAADMQAAGLSKTLAAGNPASAAALTAPSVSAAKVSPVSNSFKYESALQKMNIASLMLDMAAKDQQLEINDKVANAQVANINADTAGKELSNNTFMEEFNLNKEFKFAQTAYQKAQTARVEAETELVKVEGKYAAQKATAEINLLIAQRVKTNADAVYTTNSLEKLAAEISNIAAKTANLGKEGEKLAYEITYAELQNQIAQHNLSYAEDFYLPVGKTPGGIFGANAMSGLSFTNYLRTLLDVPTSSSRSTSLETNRFRAW